MAKSFFLCEELHISNDFSITFLFFHQTLHLTKKLVNFKVIIFQKITLLKNISKIWFFELLTRKKSVFQHIWNLQFFIVYWIMDLYFLWLSFYDEGQGANLGLVRESGLFWTLPSPGLNLTPLTTRLLQFYKKCLKRDTMYEIVWAKIFKLLNWLLLILFLDTFCWDDFWMNKCRYMKILTQLQS